MYRVKKWKNVRSRTKYKNSTCQYGGVAYHSKFEAKYAQELDLRKKAGEVLEWARQVKIPLDVNGKHVANYYIDFVVKRADGITEYVECKGYETDTWKLKWRLFEILYEDQPMTELTVVK